MNDDHAATKALPDDLLAYMRRHIKAKRDDLDGFLAIGNEVNRAATYDRWLVALSAAAAPVAPAGLHVGNLPTVNQDEYPNLGAWWVQIWDGSRVVGRAYGDTPHAAHEMAVKLSGNAAPAAPVAQCDPEGWSPAPADTMTAHKAAYFMRRFKREEKLLGPNEQAAVDFVIAMLEAHPLPAPASQPVSEQAAPPAPLTDEQIYDLLPSVGIRFPMDALWFARAIERAHGIGQGDA